MKNRYALIPILLLASNILMAGEVFDSLQIDSKQCNLVLNGTHNKGIVYRGKSDFGQCFITVPTIDFHKKYAFCALSGVLASKGRVMCEFGYYNKSHTRISFTSGPDELCEFICIKR